MIIHTHILCYNEEDILPYVLRHYGEFSDKIFVWDNYSTDESINIINSFPNTKIIPFGNPDGSSGMNAGTQTNLKISGWKKSNIPRDWINFVDADEFICSPQKNRSVRDILSDCKERGVNIPKTEGYDMYWDKEEKPTHDLPLFSQVVEGIPNWFFSKRAVFNPEVSPCCRVGGPLRN